MSRLQLAIDVADLDEAVRVLLADVFCRTGKSSSGLRQLRYRRTSTEVGT